MLVRAFALGLAEVTVSRREEHDALTREQHGGVVLRSKVT
jgi:hypothetical protein